MLLLFVFKYYNTEPGINKEFFVTTGSFNDIMVKKETRNEETKMDQVLKALACSGRVRVYIADTKDIINDAIVIHDLWPSTASVMGKALTIGAIMGAMMKGDQALTIKINGNGPIGNVIVDANAQGEVRGYVDYPHVHVSRSGSLDDVSTLGYNGYIDVIKDLKLKDLFVSNVPLQTGHLARDFTYYFLKSEQTPSMTAMGILMKEDNTAEVCGGIVIQLLPNALEEDIVFLESKAKLLESMSKLLFENKTLEDILKLVFGSDFVIMESLPLKFHCSCSKEHFGSGIASLGPKEIDAMITEDGQAEIICHYCHKRYLFSKEELETIRKGLKK